MNASGRSNGNRMKRLFYITLGSFLAGATFAAAQEQQQVNVSVKVVEFQMNKLLETGLNAYFKHKDNPQPYGRVADHNGHIESADITFPAPDAALSVFVDRIYTAYGQMEITLQALVSQNRASILSQPKVMVQVGQTVPTIIETTREVPYEDIVVVGVTATRVTNFKPTGVTLNVLATKVVDDDGNPATTEDTYIQLTLTATVNDRGQSMSVALDPIMGGSTIEVPEFISRSITTTVWVRHGQVLVLGGLYFKKNQKDLSTLPWLTQGEDFTNSLVQRIMPFTVPQVPMSASVGKQDNRDIRRELVFLIKAELWKPAFTVADDFGFTEENKRDDDKDKKESRKKSPSDVITGVIGGITDIPQDLVHGISGDQKKDPVAAELGGDKKP